MRDQGGRDVSVSVAASASEGGGEGDDDDGDEMGSLSSSSKISIVAFYVVGAIFIKAFVVVALALRHHPSFRSLLLCC